MAAINQTGAGRTVLHRQVAVLAVYSVAIFLSATLLFMVQPMVARMVLPLLGGSPAVWNTALVFFQAALLLGYGYAHLTTRLLGPRRQAILHMLLLALPLLVLPIALPVGWTPPTNSNPVPWLLLLLLVSIGLPFVVVSASSPLLQHWFAASGHPHSADPYFLYGASNLGSMLALLCYPLLLEPLLRLADQSLLWSLGYGLLVALLATCAACLWRAPVASTALVTAVTPQVSPRRIARWVLLAAAPSSLMVGATTYLSSEVASVPLLWIAPLALYLLTFILIFARQPRIPHPLVLRALPPAVLSLLYLLVTHTSKPFLLVVLVHLLVFFLVAMACHGELAADRPPPAGLTSFYMWMSFGGVVGGSFNGLLAPLLFNDVIEYPLVLTLACLLLPWPPRRRADARTLLLDLLLPLLVGVTALLLLRVLLPTLGIEGTPYQVIGFGLPLLLCAALQRHPIRFGLAIGLLFLVGFTSNNTFGNVVHTERSFFGVHKVTELTLSASGDYRALIHGNTLHGLQSLDPTRSREPLSYYHRTGPAGQIFATLGPAYQQRPIAVVGLGAGSLACYATPGQPWRFYEIDPVVDRLARDERYFSFLKQCTPHADTILGDARLTLQQAPPAHYGILVLDAYSSDAPPLHLLTREAMRVYLRSLAPDGLLVFNISNRHLDLEPVVAALAHDAGLAVLTRDDDQVTDQEASFGKADSQWVVMARDATLLAPLTADTRWKPAEAPPTFAVWTDDFASIVSLLARYESR